ncbi:MAG: hypothetical protein JWN34_85 [Bryobacterales bacterium]|nr:hypothetical protein [Bryobacterales bacterium]
MRVSLTFITDISGNICTMDGEQSIRERSKVVSIIRECRECHELLNDWNTAARAQAQASLELSADVEHLSREAYLGRFADVETKQRTASEAHLSYRLHRTSCWHVLERQRAARAEPPSTASA